MNLFGADNCYYLHATFHPREGEQYGREITIWAGNTFTISVRTCELGKHGVKSHFKDFQEMSDHIYRFVTGEEPMPIEDHLILYTPGGDVVGMYTSYEEMEQAAFKLLRDDKYTLLRVARVIEELTLGVVSNAVKATRDGGNLR